MGVVECAGPPCGEDDGLVSVRPVLDRWPNFRDLLLQDYDEAFSSLRKAEGIGRPLGTADFVIELETPARQTDCPPGPREEGNGDPGRRAVEIAAIGKLSPHYPRKLPTRNEFMESGRAQTSIVIHLHLERSRLRRNARCVARQPQEKKQKETASVPHGRRVPGRSMNQNGLTRTWF